MNTPSPLVPQGTSPDRGKSKFYFKILMIVSLHVVVFGGLLLQGCKDTKNNSSTTDSGMTASDQSSNTDIQSLPPASNNYAPAVGGIGASNLSAVPPAPVYTPPTNPLPAPIPAPLPVTTAAPEGHEYVVTRGDTLAVIAKKNGVSLKALKAANPGVDPRKLKVGAKLEVPGGGTDTASVSGGMGNGNADSGDTSEYVVKAGDMLGHIAKSHGTTVAKIKALNGLKTTSIKVGQKLKLPASAATAVAAPAMAPMPTPAPAVATPYASNATSPTGTR